MIEDVTNPPFLNEKLPNLFVHVKLTKKKKKVLPAKPKEPTPK